MNPMLLGALAALTHHERARLREAAKQATILERRWVRRFQEQISEYDEWVFPQLFVQGRFKTTEIDFLPVVLEHSYAVMSDGIRAARESNPETERKASTKLGYPNGPRIPRTLGDLKTLYDQWRKKKNLPARQVRTAERLKKAYLRRCQSVWDRYGQDFREGKEYSRSAVNRVLETKGDMARARADTIVQTETTYYYNKARRNVYDRSSDVSHYLFVAIRDQATTKWCKSRQGLVYKKDDPLLDKETPPIHWNCRSEILPLTLLNPRHRALIEDKSRARRSHRCEPLPSGWAKR